MRFIRDIIEEKKRTGGMAGVTARAEAEVRDPYMLEERHAVAQDDALEALGDDLGACQGAGFDEDEAFELLAEIGGEEDDLVSADSLFAPDAPTPDAPTSDAPTPEVPDAPAMQASQAPVEELPVAPVHQPPAASLSETSPETPPETSHVTGQEPADTPFGAYDATDQIMARRPSRADDNAAADPVQVPAPAEGRTSRRAARVKTRLLGFSPAQGGVADPLAAGAAGGGAAALFPVGWLTVTGGRGRGSGFTLHSGVSNIGRGEDQTVRLDFGDNSISRSGHAIVAYDPEQRKFFLGHGGKANLVRLNDRPVLSTELMQSGDRVRIGETTLMFTALCGGDFDWSEDAGDQHGQSDGFDHAAAG